MTSPAAEPHVDAAWTIVQAAAEAAERLEHAGVPAAFAAGADGSLQPVGADESAAIIAWRPDQRWVPVLAADDPRFSLIDLYLPICSATRSHPITVGHLGQSLDGFIATPSGDSRWVTGAENVRHMHRLRALCDAVVVGAGTVAADDPQLTTRLVAGSNPLRVVLDPMARLTTEHRLFTDADAETWYVCGRATDRAATATFGRATVVAIGDTAETAIDVRALVALLHARGCSRVFVEGGGVTMSMFVAANMLDRLHMTVAPLIIGDGRPAIRLPARAALGDCHRPRYRVFRMGGDVLFDCELRADDDRNAAAARHQPPIQRVI